MTDLNIAPYGTWPSPITSEAIVGGSVGLAEVAADGADLYWIESRPSEAGRSARPGSFLGPGIAIPAGGAAPPPAGPLPPVRSAGSVAPGGVAPPGTRTVGGEFGAGNQPARWFKGRP